jgi:tetratricopeptide (TPR) repeat protein
MRLRFAILCAATVGLFATGEAGAGPGSRPERVLFQNGNAAYVAGRHLEAAQSFAQSAVLRPAAGTLLNLGLAEWQLGNPGEAILSWERARWLSPYDGAARQNLQFARRIAQVDSPDLAWYEVVSTWLPVNWWAWLSGGCLWGSIGLAVAPVLLRGHKGSWQQAAAAFGLMLFLLTVPAQLGVSTRSRIGFILRKDTPLRLTPTKDAQALTRMAPGQPARLKRARGDFLLVQTGRSLGWVERSDFGLVCPRRDTAFTTPQ